MTNDEEEAQLRKQWKSGCEPVHRSVPGLLQQLPFSHIVLFSDIFCLWALTNNGGRIC